MTIKKRVIKPTVSAFVLMLPLVWLYLHTELGMSRKAHQIESLLLGVMQADAELTEQVLMSRSQLTLHYDDISQSQRHLNSLIAQFTPELTNNIDVLDTELIVVVNLSHMLQNSVERFKTINSQVSQRQRYIKRMADQIKQVINRRDSQQIIEQLDQIVIEVFNARVFGHQFIESDAQLHMNALSVAVNNSGATTQKLIADFITHLNRLLILESEESDVLSDILTHSMSSKIQSIRRALIDSQYQMVSDNNAMQRYLIGYASFLITLILLLVINRRYLKKNMSLHKNRSERDELTNLFNRRYFIQQLEKIIDTEVGALLFIDLDGFKLVNDTLGHEMGDEVLKSVAYRLESITGDNKLFGFTTEVFRLGGDEFVILVDGFGEDKSLDSLKDFSQLVVKRCNFALEKPHQAYTLSVSVGVSLFPMHGTNVVTVLNCADKAMYHSKQQGKNRYTFFDNIA